MSDPAVALVTGATRGLGLHLARALASRGCIVYGAGRWPVQETALEPFRRLVLDVDSERSVQEAVHKVLAEEGRLDLLVNNAGISLAGPTEEVPVPAAERLFQTNYFGAVRMIQAALPALRRRGSGAIVNISSAAGKIGVPFQAHYAASKFALEGFSEALRLEVAAFGVRVLLIEPGDVRTEIWERRAHYEKERSPYHEALDRFLTVKDREMGDAATPPEVVAEEIAEILLGAKTGFRYPVARGSRLILWARKLLPDRIYLWLVARHYGIKLRA
ncbi:MAG: SDR family oxidoreductase [Acidobacteriia bacterium]|nr:SDR family oxidoreductase [Terriglobia bacterium]